MKVTFFNNNSIILYNWFYKKINEIHLYVFVLNWPLVEQVQYSIADQNKKKNPSILFLSLQYNILRFCV